MVWGGGGGGGGRRGGGETAAGRPRLRRPLSISIDHRLIDGADGARFLTWISDAINQPLMLALEG